MTASAKENASDGICEDCGAARVQGRPGCREVFEEILAKEFSDYRYGKIHRLTVDAYALQHPEAYMRSGKSFAAHLTGMCAALEHEDTLDLNRTVQKWLSSNPRIDKPVHLPDQRGDLTIAYIHSAADADEHVNRVREWARDIWRAWTEHHDLARALMRKAIAETSKS
jgi:hypothetical protein